MDKNDWSPLLQLALGDATMLKELLREPIVEEKPEPGEEIVPAMAQATGRLGGPPAGRRCDAGGRSHLSHAARPAQR